MKLIYYKTLNILSEIFGERILSAGTWIIASGYFIFFPSRVSVGIRFYRKLFPNKGWLYSLRCVWRQYHNFTHIFTDRFRLLHNKKIDYTSEGLEYLEDAVKNKTGGILLMSHIGNWEVAIHLLKEKGFMPMLFMGAKNKEKIERLQKESLSEKGIKIIAEEQNNPSPFDILEGISHLKKGGIISITGDRIWRKDQRLIPVRFLNHTVYLPETPHFLAAYSGSPILIFFAFRINKKSYHFTMSEPIYVNASSRKERREAVQKSAQKYADILESNLRKHPLEWYHFEQFLPDHK